MWRKTVYFLIILTAFYVYILINHSSTALKSLGYNRVLDLYAEKVSVNSDIDIIYNPGLRRLDTPLEKIDIQAVVPDGRMDYEARLEEFLEGEGEAIVECSAMDTWHTTSSGKNYLYKIREKAYRIVVFDGGHHLPTLGLAPDIIIIPQFAGYAVHSYMLDGMKVEKILALARENASSSMIVTVPRWALVKNEKSLIAISRKILASSQYTLTPQETFQPRVQHRISRYGQRIYAYINRDYSRDFNFFVNRLNTIGIDDIGIIYLAFDFSCISGEEAEIFKDRLGKKLKIPVENVNEAVKVSNVYWGGR